MQSIWKVPVILASGSPRRRELLRRIVNEFDVVVSDCEEIARSRIPEDVTMELAMQKAKAVAESGVCKEETLIIGSDTVVSVDGGILGKPKDLEDAASMLRRLSGRSHQVSTGVAVLLVDSQGRIVEKKTFSETTEVRVAKISEQEIQNYIASGDGMDKAGSYGIQGIFGRHIKEIRGDYNNVVGLPVYRLYETMKQLDKEWTGEKSR